MARFWTSDEHFDHHNIIGYTGRPHPNATMMNLDMIERWNSIVGVDDETWLVGDLTLHKRLDKIAMILSRLNGRKILVVGNHDWPFARNGQPRPERDAAYLEAGFEQIVHGQTETTVGGQRMVVCHFPYKGDHGESDRYANLRPVDEGLPLICGHIHEKWRVRDGMVNIGVDAWAGYPVTDAQIIAAVAGGNADCLPWTWPTPAV